MGNSHYSEREPSHKLPTLPARADGLPLRQTLERGYAAGEGRSVTTKCLSNTLRVSGCTRLRVERQEVITKGALLLVTDQVGLQNVLACARAIVRRSHRPAGRLPTRRRTRSRRARGRRGPPARSGCTSPEIERRRAAEGRLRLLRPRRAVHALRRTAWQAAEAARRGGIIMSHPVVVHGGRPTWTLRAGRT